MAHRTSRASGMLGVSRLLGTVLLPTRTQAKKYEPIPLRSGHLACDGAERFVNPLPILIAVLQHCHRDGLILISFDQLRARRRHAWIQLPGSIGDSNRWLSFDGLL